MNQYQVNKTANLAEECSQTLKRCLEKAKIDYVEQNVGDLLIIGNPVLRYEADYRLVFTQNQPIICFDFDKFVNQVKGSFPDFTVDCSLTDEEIIKQLFEISGLCKETEINFETALEDIEMP